MNFELTEQKNKSRDLQKGPNSWQYFKSIETSGISLDKNHSSRIDNLTNEKLLIRNNVLIN